MAIHQNISLKNYNTFGIDVCSKWFARFSTHEALFEILAEQEKLNISQSFILGGGSNILFTNNFNGLILKNELTGIAVIKEDDNHIYVKAGAGEVWHNFVLYCINNNYAGVENLSLIPGTVGASPIQNIGAYGVELKDVFFELEAYHTREQQLKTFSLSECAFEYRQSIFKTTHKNDWIITSVTFKLNKKPNFNTSYGAIAQELQQMKVTTLSLKAISEAVIHIRTSKLPNPKEIGNAGSFFKNPTIGLQQLNELKKQFPTIPNYATIINNVTHYKIAAGWLIEQCGFKGYRKGNTGCYEKQALVLVNYGNAIGEEIVELSNIIVTKVENKFGINLEKEVNII